MAGYTRQSTADIIPTATVRAAPINAEYNALRDAFAASGGHKHDGTTGEGEYVPLIADLDALNKIVVDTTNNRFGVFVEVGATAVEQVRFQDGVIVPVTDNDIDLGTSSVEFKNLYLDGTAKIDTLTVDENATIAGTLGVTSNTTLGGTLGVTGATTLSSTLGVTGNTTLSGTLGVTGATTLSSTLAVTGSATLSSTLSVSSNATVGGTLAVTGTTSSTGDFSVNTNKFTVAAGTGNTAVAGTLGVTGNTTVGGTLGVTGATTLSSTAAISGNTTIGGTLGVTGTTTYSTLTGANLTATGTVNFAGATVSNLGTVTTAAIGGGTINNTIIGGSTPAAITGTTITGTSLVGPVTGNVTGDITGDVTGNVTASSGASTFNNVTINGTLDVTNTTIENVSDPTTAQQAATKAYVDSEITNLIGGAPAALDTLNELAAAINDDENVYTTLTTSIATKLPKAGGTMTGAIAMGNNKITGLATPTADADATTKAYVDQIETDAEAQATAAAASAAAAAASYDSFDDRYLGSKASDPTLDNDGNALLTGALYFDSTNSVMKVYNGSEWVNASSSIEGIKSNFYYTATSGQTVFSGADDNTNTLVVDQVDLVNVYMNGVRLHEDDYTVSAAGNSVTLATGAATGDLIYLEVFGNFAGQSGAEVAITGGSITGLSDFGAAQGAFTGNVTFAGNTSYGDNDKAIFGAGSDLQIYHDGTDNYVDAAGVGHLYLQSQGTDRDVKIRSDDGFGGLVDYITVDGSLGQVKLRYYGDVKLNTTSTGIDVTGEITADGLTVDGNTVRQNGTLPFYLFMESDTTDLNTQLLQTAGQFRIRTVNDAITSSTERLRIDHATGDISFYEDTGTTAKFFWDASAERLELGDSVSLRGGSSSRMVLAETTAAAINWLEIQSSTTGRTGVIFSDGGSGNYGLIDYDHTDDHLKILTASTEAMRIDSSGNVGIGTDSPSQLLEVAGNDARISINDTNSTVSGAVSIVEFDATDGRGGYVGLVAGDLTLYTDAAQGAEIRFSSGGSEAMRIDSSGNLLVGTTSSPTTLATTGSVEGFGYDANDFAVISRASGNPLILNRLTDDGVMLSLRRNGSVVGSIGASGGTIYIGKDDTTLRFDSGATPSIKPSGTDGATLDATTDLGDASNRWKDLYLSGGVVFGDAGGSGTSTSNTLDSYEEGTWTPTIQGATTAGTATYLGRWGNYTKIGNLVTVRFYINVNSFTGTGTMQIAGLPFTSGSDNGIQAGSFYPTRINANITLTSDGYLSIPVTENTTLGFFVSTSATSPAISSSINCDAAFACQFEGSYFV